jgi:hypothetical protein
MKPRQLDIGFLDPSPFLQKVPVLSLRQPWAEAIFQGFKAQETRSWPTAHRGPLFIHASKGRSPEGRQKWENLGLDKRTGRAFDSLDFGAIIGIVNVTGCKKIAGSEWLVSDPRNAANVLEYFLGDYTPGRYYFPVKDAERLAYPVPFEGMLSIWDAVKRADGITSLLNLELSAHRPAGLRPDLYGPIAERLRLIYDYLRKQQCTI